MSKTFGHDLRNLVKKTVRAVLLNLLSTRGYSFLSDFLCELQQYFFVHRNIKKKKKISTSKY